jgi:hypothetical protein
MGHVFPQGLKPNAYADFYGTDKSVPFQDICPFQEIRDRSRDPRPFTTTTRRVFSLIYFRG